MTATLLAHPDDDRPRERLLALGPDGLSDRELLALVIGFGGGAGGSAIAAAALLRRFGTLHDIDRAAFSELVGVPGLGVARACALKASLCLGRRVVSTERVRGERMRTAADVHARLAPALRHHQREVFVVVLLDARHRLMKEVRIAEGGLTACAIQPREVFEPVIREGAAAVIFAHNHPSGDPSPSTEDLALTGRLCLAAEALGVRALDHVVIGDGSFVSLAEQGLMGGLS